MREVNFINLVTACSSRVPALNLGNVKPVVHISFYCWGDKRDNRAVGSVLSFGSGLCVQRLPETQQTFNKKGVGKKIKKINGRDREGKKRKIETKKRNKVSETKQK